MKRLLILSCPNKSTEDDRFSTLAGLMGVSTEVLPFANTIGALQDLLGRARAGNFSLAMHMATLGRLHSESNAGNALLQTLDSRFQEVLVYGATTSAEINTALAGLTDGAVHSITSKPAQAVRYSFAHGARALCAQLARQNVVINRGHSAFALKARSGTESVEAILTANGQPMFLRFKTPVRDVFLYAGEMPDIDKPLGQDTGLGDDDCIQLLPPLIFLRHCFRESCWKGPETTARLIIDDPILTRTYGALDFDNLKASMRRFGYGTSIAFIPWNYWRTSGRTASLLFGDGSNLSICVHGCDHTNREFASVDETVLTQKAALGIERMRRHEKRAGVPFEDVMVFPQGKFSRAAIPALRKTNYLAGVNTSCLPTDSAPDDLRISDLLWPAVTRFDGFPIFLRRYPRNLFGFALDLYLGKPALLVEHHEFFRDGCKAIEEFIAGLQEIEPGLSWPSLTTQLMQSNLRRRLDCGYTEVRFFTRRFHLVPCEGEQGRYVLSKPEPDSSIIQKVVVNGKSTPFGFENGCLKFEIESEMGQVNTVEIIDQAAPFAARSFGFAYNTRVFIRRGLSEFRDNTLSHHRGALKMATRFVKTIKATGDS